MITFEINSQSVSFDGEASTPLLWVIRDHLQLTGTKFGCGAGQCGACTVHVDGKARKSCMLSVRSVAGRSVTTIEGLARDDENLHPVQKAWLKFDVPQCGYCQAGQIMAAVDLLDRSRLTRILTRTSGISVVAARMYVSARRFIMRPS
jgi:isoquinoline 1-oxidoreductase alpha subunit